MQTAMGAAATVVATAFAMATFERWLAARRRHDLAWSAALVLFALASAALTAGATMGWDGVTFRVFFLLGAIVNVPVLALGTVYLLGGRTRGDRVALAIIAFAAFAAGVVVTAPFTASLPRHELARGSEVFGPLPLVLAVIGSAGGTFVVLGGAVLSAWRRRLVVANLLIAAGTGITAMSGVLNSVFDEMTGFAVALVAGISVIFAGFLVAGARRDQAPRAALSAGPDAAASRPAPEAATRRT